MSKFMKKHYNECFANPTEDLLSVYPFLFLFLFLVFYPSYHKVYTQIRNNNFIVVLCETEEKT